MSDEPQSYRLPDGRELIELAPGQGLLIDKRRNTAERVSIETIEITDEAPCTPLEPDQVP